VLRAGRAVEGAGRDQDAELGQRCDGRHRILSSGRPQVQPGAALVDPEAGRLERGQHRGAPGAIAFALLGDVPIIAESGDHGVLHRSGRHESGVLARREQLVDEVGAAGDESGAVPGQVRLLAQGVDREHQAPAVADHARIEDRRRRLIAAPDQLGVALVVHDHGAQFTRPRDGRRQVLDRVDVAVGIARTVEPDQPGLVRPLGWVVRGERGGSGQRGAYGIGGVGDGRVDHDVAGAQTEQHRHPGHQFFGADGRQHIGHTERDAAPPAVPVDDRLAQCGRTRSCRIGVRVGGGRQRIAHQLRRGVDGRADREVDDAVRMLPRPVPERDQGIPRKVGQRERRALGHYWPWGGRAAIRG